MAVAALPLRERMEAPATKPQLSFARDDKKRLTIAHVSTYDTDGCGISSFTRDKIEGIEAADPTTRNIVVAMNVGKNTYFGDRVGPIIQKDNRADYVRAAEFINRNGVDIVAIEHEFGIMNLEGLRDLIASVNVPVVINWHTVEDVGEFPARDRVQRELSNEADVVIAANEKAKSMLKDDYGVRNGGRIKVVYHGIPETSRMDEGEIREIKEELGLEGKIVIATSGYVVPSKGIKYVLRVLPEIIKEHPNVMYTILGSVNDGNPESVRYKESLVRLVRRLGLEDHTSFAERYLPQEEMEKNLASADFYAATSTNTKQISSGTLPPGMAAGNAVVASRFYAAEELLRGGVGLIAGERVYRDIKGRRVAVGIKGVSQGIYDHLMRLLENPDEVERLQDRAYDRTRDMTWPRTGDKLLGIYRDAIKEKERVGKRLPVASFDYQGSAASYSN